MLPMHVSAVIAVAPGAVAMWSCSVVSYMVRSSSCHCVAGVGFGPPAGKAKAHGTEATLTAIGKALVKRRPLCRPDRRSDSMNCFSCYRMVLSLLFLASPFP